MDLWQILVLGVVRLGLEADWDRMEHLANYDALVRQMLGVPAAPWGEEDKRFGHQTLRDNVALLDAELLQQINAAIAAAGREGFAKKGGAPGAAREVKADSYVLASDVHFPTGLNLLWAASARTWWQACALRVATCPAGASSSNGGGNSRPASAPPASSSIAAGRTRQPV